MSAEPLPASVQTLYSELLDLAIQAEAGRIAEGLPAGTFVAKEIRGARYWYLQVAVGAQKAQRYLGRETPELLRWMEKVAATRESGLEDSALRERLVAMLIRGGAHREEAPSGRVLRLLADLGVFHRGGVLVGTHAFQAYGNLLGLRFEQRHQRTEDIHSAHDLAIAFGLLDEPRAEVERSLVSSGLGLLPVPGLDPRSPATSFKVRGRELRIDFLVPARSKREEAPVAIPGLGVSAQPLWFLDYLIEAPIPAVILHGAGILAQVPTPARFALHKLWVARDRPAAFQVRSLKDRRQARALLEVLVGDRPHDLREAWEALAERKSARKIITAEIGALPAELRDRLAAIGVAKP